MNTSKNNLDLAEAVRPAFNFIEEDYGFLKMLENKDLVRFESRKLFLEIRHQKSRSYGVGIRLGRLAKQDQYFSLKALIAGLAPSFVGPTDFQASTQQAMLASVSKIASTLKAYCGPALAGEAEALEQVEQAQRLESERLLLQFEHGAVVSKADRAWEAKNFPRALELYEQTEQALDKTRRRRLQYLIGMRNKQDLKTLAGSEPESGSSTE